MLGAKKIKKIVSFIALFLIFAMVVGTIASALTGCGAAQEESSSETETISEEVKTDPQPETKEPEDNADPQSETKEPEEKDDSLVESSAEKSNEEVSQQDQEANDDVTIRVAALKGPTTIGLVNLIDDVNKNETDLNCEFEMYTAGSDIMAAMVAGTVDIGLVPSNVACVMNTKVEGGVSVIDINTLGVLYCVTTGDKVKSVADLAGKTLYATGQGATPEYTIKYLLDGNGVTDCTLEFKSEPTEIVSILSEDPEAVAVLPQPFVTAALAQNENLAIAFSLDDEWEAINSDCKIVTGVTVAANKFIEEHKSAVDAFIEAHEKSAKEAVTDVDATAALVVEQGIIAKEPLAKMAIPNCNIVCLKGADIQNTLKGYLEVLFEQDPKSVGGSLPGDEFYYGG